MPQTAPTDRGNIFVNGREEQFLRGDLLDRAGILVFCILPDERAVSINSTMSKLLAVRDAELRLVDILSQDSVEAFRAAMHRARATHESVLFTTNLKDAEEKSIAIAGAMTDTGREAVLCVAQQAGPPAGPAVKEGSQAVIPDDPDLIRQKKLEDELRDSEERYRTIFENTGTAMVLIDDDTTILLANTEMERLSGYSRDTIEGRMSWTRFVSGEDLERMVEYHRLRRIDPSLVPKNYEFTILRCDGEKVPAFLTISRIAGTRQTIASVQDITERKNAEKALKEREQESKALLNTIPDLILRMDDAGVIRDYNAAPGVPLYMPPEEFLGKPLGAVMPARLRKKTEQVIEQAFVTGRKQNFFYKLKIKSVMRHFEARILASAEHECIALIRDITEQRKAQIALQEANEKLCLLSSITRHDILNQVQGLLWFSGELQRQIENQPELRSLVEKIIRASETINHQITFTRDYENMGMTSPEWQRVDSVVQRASATILPENIRLDPGTGDLEIYADIMLERVFYNLIDNAVRYAGPGLSCIGVSFHPEGDTGVIVVTDDGRGIPPDKKEMVFKRGIGRHTGYGLFLVREILSLTQIKIRETGTFTKGARFEISVPPGKWRQKTGIDRRSGISAR
jgi:PAS domain S-box-containing protein